MSGETLPTSYFSCLSSAKCFLPQTQPLSFEVLPPCPDAHQPSRVMEEGKKWTRNRQTSYCIFPVVAMTTSVPSDSNVPGDNVCLMLETGAQMVREYQVGSQTLSIVSLGTRPSKNRKGGSGTLAGVEVYTAEC